MKNLSRNLTIAVAFAGLVILMSIATLSCKKGDEITTKPLHSVTTTSK